ncbi:MAG TPA: hypothetical protein VJB12_01270, partial [Candidatus Nanoarchaeia archaeon]|nr:hypothetical protein [Candidatus Nanoarchaeia archaeon]
MIGSGLIGILTQAVRGPKPLRTDSASYDLVGGFIHRTQNRQSIILGSAHEIDFFVGLMGLGGDYVHLDFSHIQNGKPSITGISYHDVGGGMQVDVSLRHAAGIIYRVTGIQSHVLKEGHNGTTFPLK